MVPRVSFSEVRPTPVEVSAEVWYDQRSRSERLQGDTFYANGRARTLGKFGTAAEAALCYARHASQA